MMMGMGTPRKNRSSERIIASGVKCVDLRSGVALPSAVSGCQAGDECADKQRDEEPQRGIGGSLARLVSSVSRRGFRITQVCLHACIRITHALLCVLLCQTGALRNNLADVPNVFRGQGSRPNGVHEDAGNFGRGCGSGLLRSTF